MTCHIEVPCNCSYSGSKKGLILDFYLSVSGPKNLCCLNYSFHLWCGLCVGTWEDMVDIIRDCPCSILNKMCIRIGLPLLGKNTSLSVGREQESFPLWSKTASHASEWTPWSVARWVCISTWEGGRCYIAILEECTSAPWGTRSSDQVRTWECPTELLRGRRQQCWWSDRTAPCRSTPAPSFSQRLQSQKPKSSRGFLC